MTNQLPRRVRPIDSRAHAQPFFLAAPSHIARLWLSVPWPPPTMLRGCHVVGSEGLILAGLTYFDKAKVE